MPAQCVYLRHGAIALSIAVLVRKRYQLLRQQVFELCLAKSGPHVVSVAVTLVVLSKGDVRMGVLDTDGSVMQLMVADIVEEPAEDVATAWAQCDLHS